MKKKDMKLQEINRILEQEVNPQLDVLRKDKQEFSVFKSNESQIEEMEKISVAHDYWENDIYIKQSL